MRSGHILLSLFLLNLSVPAARGAEAVTVSPGDLEIPTVVTSICPTFSWSPAAGAQTYEVAVFELLGPVPGTYEEQIAWADPILYQTLPAPSLSWTPPAHACLAPGSIYVWYVRGIDASGSGVWSQGYQFEVDPGETWDSLEEAVEVAVSRQLSEPETIEWILTRLRERSVRPAETERRRSTSVAARSEIPAGADGSSGDFSEGREGQSEAASFPNPSAFRVSSASGVVFDDADSSAGLIPAEGNGGRFMWYPGKRALRAGFASGGVWDDANIGGFSVAMGQNTKASGWSSIAMGDSTIASGSYSTAMGNSTTASGSASTAMGNVTTAESAFETVIGRFDTDYTPESTTLWEPDDRLFVIGNGSASNAPSDAMVVRKNGNVGIGTSEPDVRLHLVGEESTPPLHLVAGSTSEHMRLTPRSSLPTGATEGDVYANANGTIYYRSNSAWTAMNAAADFSELIVPAGSNILGHEGTAEYEGQIEAAEIISINENGHYARCDSPYGERISGVESGDRGIYHLPEGSAERAQGQRQFGAIGHVRLKVSAENGAIAPGDFITCSASRPGVGMKATARGRVVGIAKEGYEAAAGEIGLIEVFVNPQTRLLGDDSQKLSHRASANRTGAENAAPKQEEDGSFDFDIHAITVAMVNAIHKLEAENEALKTLVCQGHPQASLCQ